MADEVDVLFVTRIGASHETGDPSVYEPLRLRIAGRVASLPTLRTMAAALGGTGDVLSCLGAKGATFDNDSVLTPFYMNDYLGRRGISFEEIGDLELDRDRAKKTAQAGVRVIALSTTWIASQHPAEDVRAAAAFFRSIAPHTAIVVGGVGVRKAERARRLRRTHGGQPKSRPGLDAEHRQLRVRRLRGRDCPTDQRRHWGILGRSVRWPECLFHSSRSYHQCTRTGRALDSPTTVVDHRCCSVATDPFRQGDQADCAGPDGPNSHRMEIHQLYSWDGRRRVVLCPRSEPGHR